MQLWKETPGMCGEIPVIEEYIPEQKASDMAVVIFPGGAYVGRAPHEGKGYAEFLRDHGICAFVVQYRVSPHRFPLPLLDARRAVRTVRAKAAEYGIDKNKIAVMGSSAGGHLAALTSTYTAPIDFEGLDEIDNEDFLPNAQILCYPVILAPDEEKLAHVGSYQMLLGDKMEEMKHQVAPAELVTEKTPQAFIWHTSDDAGVNSINSCYYAAALRKHNVPYELHILPHGAHGLGLAQNLPHVAQWPGLLLNWFKEIGWME